jgi:sugar phosphate isomerase/epimerase
MLLGYNTNGLAHHDLVDAIHLLAEIGYRSVAITIDQAALNPFDDRLSRQLQQVRDALQQHSMRSVIETGARFLLDPRAKHEPTLMTSGSQQGRRIEFLCRAIEIAKSLNSDCVSLWSGIVRDRACREDGLRRLADGLQQVIDYAAQQQVVLGFEPEPGMFIDTMARFEALLEWIDAPNFRLTLDVGHLHCQREEPIADYIRRWGPRIVNVHIEDMQAGVHEHLMFGAGEIDFPPIIDALAEVGYQGGLHVELSRHSHEGPAAAQRAFEFLSPLVNRFP